MPTVKKASIKQNWKVVYWIYKSSGVIQRRVIGRAYADRAWKLYWSCRGRSHIAKGPELWRGRERLL